MTLTPSICDCVYDFEAFKLNLDNPSYCVFKFLTQYKLP